MLEIQGSFPAVLESNRRFSAWVTEKNGVACLLLGSPVQEKQRQTRVSSAKVHQNN